jgi:hypothetical protein
VSIDKRMNEMAVRIDFEGHHTIEVNRSRESITPGPAVRIDFTGERRLTPDIAIETVGAPARLDFEGFHSIQ